MACISGTWSKTLGHHMSYGVEEDVWQIDPVTARVRPDDVLRNPVLVVVGRDARGQRVEPAHSLARAVSEICDFLHVTLVTVADPRDITSALANTQPIAIIQEADSVDCTVYDLLMIVAGHDPGLPVMLILPDAPQNRGALDAAQRLWQLEEITLAPQRPGIRALIDFLFHAGRRYGRTHFMPV